MAKWTNIKVSTSGEVTTVISNKLAQPVGIIVTGVDCEFKNNIVSALTLGCSANHFSICYGAPSTSELAHLFQTKQQIFVVLHSEESCSHELRHECVQVMRALGAQSVAGVYVNLAERSTQRNYALGGQSAFRTYARRLAKDPPTADGLDYFTIVEE